MSLSDKRCKCEFAIKMNGDGCQYCQPQTTIDFMADHIEDLEAENKALRDAIDKHKKQAAVSMAIFGRDIIQPTDIELWAVLSK